MTAEIVHFVVALVLLLALLTQSVFGRLELRDLKRRRLEREAMRRIRQASKPIRFHANGCPFGRTATCLCGRDPIYSPAARAARGECAGEPGAVEALRRRGEKSL